MKKNSILFFLERLLGRGKHTYGNNYAFYSPFIQHRKPKLEINTELKSEGDFYWKCWVSNEGGKSIATLLRKIKADRSYFTEFNSIIAREERKLGLEKIRLYSGSLKVVEQISEGVSLPDNFLSLTTGSLDIEGRNAKKYLLNRGLTETDIRSYKIGYCKSGQYGGMVVVPSYDSSYNLNYFVGRSYYKDSQMKYKNPQVSKDIIGFEYRLNWDLPVVLCEGVFDAIAISHNAIPLFGKEIGGVLKKNIIRKLNSKLYICLDTDAINNSYKIAKELSDEGIDVSIVELDGKDAGEIGYTEVWSSINNSKKFSLSTLVEYRLRNI